MKIQTLLLENAIIILLCGASGLIHRQPLGSSKGCKYPHVEATVCYEFRWPEEHLSCTKRFGQHLFIIACYHHDYHYY